MASFSVREEPNVLLIKIEEAGALNDFRPNGLRDSLYETIQSDSGNRVGLDLSQVDFLSSSGVAILVGLKRRLEGKQGKLVLFHVQPVVRDLLRVTRLSQYFEFADDEPAALALLRPTSPV